MAFNIGEKPGRGRYQCVFSDDVVTLETDDDALPACPNTDCLIAHETRWEKAKFSKNS
ncbi:hypothetical protein SAMN02745823_02694 [Sporobacter termitidis DSM 10068]|uniref:Uncharacterized protein n=1 Tax=Sporobacter termitidis DSM 10068 TaxID=1123282 RepID=A0A1M5YMY7_9FIRM|nr:hypothetical protein [Sporobacter termitidis]SHI13457.1 hypothetical protein SAMN02745823_02694 [Sporobacter termitidis DSM 10068]